MAWSIFWDHAKIMRIPEAFASLWAQLQSQLITNYLSNLDHQLTHLLAPPQIIELIHLWVNHFIKVLLRAP